MNFFISSASAEKKGAHITVVKPSYGARLSARRAVKRSICLILILSSLILIMSPAVTVDAADTRPYIGDRYGVTREKLVKWLQSHENDYYYIGTPYDKLAYTAPNGDPYCALSPAYNTNGRPAMNCAGFVAHVVYKSGLDVAKWNKYLADNHPALYYRQSYSIASADMWYLHVTGDTTGLQGDKELTGAFRYYSFPSITAALQSGKMRKGDLFIFWPKEGYAKDRVYQDSHIGIYWGDTAGENKFWHMLWPYDTIGPIYTFKGPYDFIVVPLSEDTNSGTLTLTEKNEQGSLLSGATYTVTDDKSGFKYTVGPTGGDGTASAFLPAGKYTVTHSKFPSGYNASYTTSWSVTVSKGKTVYVDTVCARPAGTLEITQTDGVSCAPLSGASFTAVRTSDKASVNIGPTGSNGKTNAKLLPGTYKVTQTAFPADHLPKSETTWTVKITEKTTSKLSTFAIPDKGAIGISAVDSEGEPIVGVYFSLRDKKDLSAKPIAEIMTDYDGKAVFGLENNKYSLDHMKVFYLHFERSARDNYIPDTNFYRVVVHGGETTWVSGVAVTIFEKSEITLSSAVPEGEYAIFTDADCEKAANIPNEDMSATVPAYITSGESVFLAPGTYYLRLNEDTSGLHDWTSVVYPVTAKAFQSVEVSADGAVTQSFVRHRYEKDGETAQNEKGFATHLCAGCEEFFLFGDVNGDGVLNAKDVTLMMRASAGIKVSLDYSVSDVNADGKFNARDVIALMRLVMKSA